MSDAAIIRQLRERCDELEETLRQLRADTRASQVIFPAEWRLTRVQEVILRTIYQSVGGRATFDQLESAIETARVGYGDHTASRGNIAVQVCKLRKTLRPMGGEIKTVWGQGYFLPSASRQLIREAVETQVAA